MFRHYASTLPKPFSKYLLERDQAVMRDLSRRTMLLALGAAGVAGALPRGARAQQSANLTNLTLREASEQIRARTLTSTQLTRAYLERVAVVDGRVNAIITVMGEQALERSRLLDEEAESGRFRSALHGIPIVVKDNIETKGVRTTAASAALNDYVPTQDADVLRRLGEAGVVLLGKSNMDEFALRRESVVSAFGPVRNPWNLDFIVGGSSGGSAAAVAAHLCAAGVGTDSGGSVRIPASNCGVVGLKPTYGLISVRGIIPLVPSVDTCGLLARTVEDAAMLLNEMVGYDALDIVSVDHAREDYIAAMRQPVRELRVGIPRSPYFDDLDADTRRCIDVALGVVRRLTRSLGDVSLPSMSPRSIGALVVAEIQSVLRPYQAHADAFQPATRAALEGFRAAINDTNSGSSADKVAGYIESRHELDRLRRTIDEAFDDFDLVVLPTNREVFGTIANALRELDAPPARPSHATDNSMHFNFFGTPAISIPCGFSRRGLPIGMTIAGPHFSEGKVLALAHAYEAATKWRHRQPPL